MIFPTFSLLFYLAIEGSTMVKVRLQPHSLARSTVSLHTHYYLQSRWVLTLRKWANVELLSQVTIVFKINVDLASCLMHFLNFKLCFTFCPLSYSHQALWRQKSHDHEIMSLALLIQEKMVDVFRPCNN